MLARLGMLVAEGRYGRLVSSNPLLYDFVRQDRRARSTKARILIIDCHHIDNHGFARDESRWALVCWTHSTILHLPVAFDTYKDAVWQSSHPEHWCEVCHEIAELEGIITGEFRR